jgi:hypothetical protein
MFGHSGTDCTYQSGYGIKEVLKHSNKVVSPYKTNPFGFCNEKVVLLPKQRLETYSFCSVSY